jgi:Smg protein
VVNIVVAHRVLEFMKESVLDVLIYLFDHYVEEEFEITPDQQDLKTQLVQAGFADTQVDKAIDWLEGLATQKDKLDVNVLRSMSIRVFNDTENEKLDVDCKGFLLFLEQSGVLDADDRELVIDRVMALETDSIELQQLKWVVLMVLFNRPGKEAAFVWMEDIVMDELSAVVH